MMLYREIVLGIYFTILTILSIYGTHRLWILYLYYKHKNETPVPLGDASFLPKVTVQLAVFNEYNVVERLIAAVTELDYPKDKLEIQVLDDSTDHTKDLVDVTVARYKKLGFDIYSLHRIDRRGYKAGALEEGLRVVKGEFVAMFDADFVPDPDFLIKAVPYFKDNNIAFIQGCWTHLNRSSSLLTQVQGILLDGHFVFEHTVRHRSNAFFNFSGTAGMWRVSAIEDAGGWQHDTITEDADLSYRAQLKGWRGVYLKDLLVPAELPTDVNAFKSQQHRWAKGNAQVIRKLMPTIWKSKASLHTKIECWFHLTANCNYLLVVILSILMIPAMVLRAGTPVHVLMMIDGPFFALNALSIGLYFGLSQKELTSNEGWKSRLKFIPGLMSLGVGLAFNQSKAVLEGFFTNDKEFTRTPKMGHGYAASNTRIKYKVSKSVTTYLELLFAFAFLISIFVSIYFSKWASLPFLILFFNGYAYMSLLSLVSTDTLKSFTKAEIEDDHVLGTE
jgi:cellulose synthase/poly-beta-1,6-N-acetylglucosamine synthase-like glycosyltransferase